MHATHLACVKIQPNDIILKEKILAHGLLWKKGSQRGPPGLHKIRDARRKRKRPKPKGNRKNNKSRYENHDRG